LRLLRLYVLPACPWRVMPTLRSYLGHHSLCLLKGEHHPVASSALQQSRVVGMCLPHI